MKKLLSFLLIFVFALGLFTVSVKAEDNAKVIISGNCGDNVTYVLKDNGVLTISGTGSMYDYSDTKKAPWSSHKEEILSIKIDSDVENIGNYAFENCSNLASIAISDTVSSIGSFAFSGCSGLLNMDLSETDVASIGEKAFNGCSKLSYIKFPSTLNSIGADAFLGCSDKLGEVYYPSQDSLLEMQYGNAYANPMALGLPSDEFELFVNDVKITSLTISGFTTVKDYALYNCKQITSISVLDDVTSIGEYAFYGCSNVETLSLGSKLETIGDYAFYGCSKVKTLNIPDTVASIGQYAFYDCSLIETLTLGSNIVSIGDYAFYNLSNATSLSLPNKLQTIGNYAFSGLTKIVSLIIPDTVTSIGEYAFFNCSAITSIEIKGSLIEIKSNAFSGCSSLKTLQIPINVGNTASDSFTGISNLTDIIITGNGDGPDYTKDSYQNTPWYVLRNNNFVITLSDTITKIGDYTFKDQANIQSITLPSVLATIGEYAFNNCSSIASITMPISTTIEAKSSFNNVSNITSVVLTKGTGVGVDYPDDTYSVTPWANTTKNFTVSMSDDITKIGINTFRNCDLLTSINIPTSLITIGANAFDSCTAIKTISFSDKIVSIEEDAFNNCSSLTSVNYDSLSTLFYLVFKNAQANPMNNNGTTLYIDNVAITTLEIPDTISKIENYAFYNCSQIETLTLNNHGIIGKYAFYNLNKISSLVIPDSVIEIGEGAFDDCVSLTSLTVPISVECGNRFRGVTKLINITFTPGTGYGANYERTYEKTPWYLSKDNENITITLNEGIKTIGSYAFPNQFYLKSIVFPESLESIGNESFAYSKSLKEIVIPENCKRIGTYEFFGCESLEKFIVKGSLDFINYLSFNDDPKLKKVYFDKIEYLLGAEFSDEAANPMRNGADLYIGGNLANSISIPNTISTIKQYAFYYCKSVTSIGIPDSVNKIEKMAFEGCSNLSSINIPNTINIIEASVFKNCSSLGDVCLSKNITAISDELFYGTTSMQTVWLPGSATSFGTDVFKGANDSLVIYVDATKKPDAWPNNFNYNGKTNLTVIYNTSQEQYLQDKTMNTYSVIFNSNEGINTKVSVPNELKNVEYDKDYILRSDLFPNVTKTGYSITKWNTKENGSGTTYSAGDVFRRASSDKGNMILYAIWNPNTYTIKYDANTGFGLMSNQDIRYDSSANLASNTFNKNGYSFLSWNTRVDGTGVEYSDGAAVKNLLTGGSMTLYAQWGLMKYGISYNLGGGTTNAYNPTSYNILSNTINLSEPTRKGYTFAGWYDQNGRKVETIASGSFGNLVLTAKWTENTYKLSYDANGGSGSLPSSVTYKTTDKNVVTSDVPTRNGYEFLGWSLNKDATIATYVAGDDITGINGEEKSGSTITLYAVYKANPSDDKSKEEDSKVNPTPKKEGLSTTTKVIIIAASTVALVGGVVALILAKKH